MMGPYWFQVLIEAVKRPDAGTTKDSVWKNHLADTASQLPELHLLA